MRLNGAFVKDRQFENNSIKMFMMQACEDLKPYLDATWEAYWLVCIGSNFGSYVTYVTRDFVFSTTMRRLSWCTKLDRLCIYDTRKLVKMIATVLVLLTKSIC